MVTDVNIPQLQVQTTSARLGLQIDKPIQEIEQPKATLRIEQPAAILEMSTTPSELTLDTTENRAALDLMSMFRRGDEVAQYSQQKVQEGIARRAQEGMQLAKIESGGNPLADIVKQNSEKPMADLGIRFVGNPLQLKRSFTPGRVDIHVTPQKPIIDAQVNKPIHNYTPGNVTAKLEQYPTIEIDWKV
ncbi:hypothetical protein SporoP33_12880 [Sporosarcina sp. P33]|nr:hypothetical protein SporoP33_12880 [Sporosarcina sp. P33]